MKGTEVLVLLKGPVFISPLNHINNFVCCVVLGGMFSCSADFTFKTFPICISQHSLQYVQLASLIQGTRLHP